MDHYVRPPEVVRPRLARDIIKQRYINPKRFAGLFAPKHAVSNHVATIKILNLNKVEVPY